MKITCSQMDVLISFYIEDELSRTLKKEVENHLKNCSTCRAKYDIIYSMINDLNNSLHKNPSNNNDIFEQTAFQSRQYQLFKNNLSAYIDNELSGDENVKIKKFAINNQRARKELENSYHIRSLIKDSFNKTKNELKTDYSKSIVKNIHNKTENTKLPNYTKISITLCSIVLLFSVIVLILL